MYNTIGYRKSYPAPHQNLPRPQTPATISLECSLLAVLGLEGILKYGEELMKLHQIEKGHLSWWGLS